MNTQERADFIRENADLFWFIPETEKTRISDECLVETILNYGTLNAVVRMIGLLGVDRAARIFYDSMARSARRENHYNELTQNFFRHVFKRYAHRDSN